MAKIRPQELPSEIRNEPFRQSEILFFDAAKLLPDNWFVLYGVTWYLRIRNNSWSEGEADFVIISPETGLVVIEVKGGRIGRDDDGWYSIDRNGEKHRIKDPALQAANCKHNLIRSIKNRQEFMSRDIPARHMVCFPNISELDSPNLIDVPREMQILAEDFDRLKECILDFSNRNYNDIGSTNVRLSPKECSLIADILKPNFDCPNRWSTQAKKQNAIMNLLTDEQSYLWEIMEDNNRLLLSGPAGSGKTILAMKLIKNVIDNGGTALALLPSKALKNYYKETINSTQLKVNTYQISENSDIIDRTNYSIIVVDEAQDITEDQWLLLYDMYQIENAEKFLCVFDSNQRLKKGSSDPIENLIPIRLTKVLRNTQQIGEFSTKFYTGDKPCIISGPSGMKVQFSEIASTDDITDTVVKTINHYVFEEGFDYSDIVVLFADNSKTYFKKEGNGKNSLGISFRSTSGFENSYAHKSPFILTEGVFAYRGLESKIVILTGLDDLNDDTRENACYIGSSRARNILHILASNSTIQRFIRTR